MTSVELAPPLDMNYMIPGVPAPDSPSQQNSRLASQVSSTIPSYLLGSPPRTPPSPILGPIDRQRRNGVVFIEESLSGGLSHLSLSPCPPLEQEEDSKKQSLIIDGEGDSRNTSKLENYSNLTVNNISNLQFQPSFNNANDNNNNNDNKELSTSRVFDILSPTILQTTTLSTPGGSPITRIREPRTSSIFTSMSPPPPLKIFIPQPSVNGVNNTIGQGQKRRKFAKCCLSLCCVLTIVAVTTVLFTKIV